LTAICIARDAPCDSVSTEISQHHDFFKVVVVVVVEKTNVSKKQQRERERERERTTNTFVQASSRQAAATWRQQHKDGKPTSQFPSFGFFFFSPSLNQQQTKCHRFSCFNFLFILLFFLSSCFVRAGSCEAREKSF
jgi:hypothetical protein